MVEKLAEVLELYDLEVLSTRKGRGATILNSTNGLYILEAYRGNLTRLEQEYVLKILLKEKGFQWIDEIIPNTDGIMFTCDRYRQPFVMKKHYEGEECDMHSEEDMVRAVRLLAQMHRSGRLAAKELDQVWKKRCRDREQKRLLEIRHAVENGEELERLARIYDIRENILVEMLSQNLNEESQDASEKESNCVLENEQLTNQENVSSGYGFKCNSERDDIGYVLKRHNQELGKIKEFIRKVKRKNTFEQLFLEVFQRFYQQGKVCLEQLNSAGDDGCLRVAQEYFGICHGAYNQHNIILNETGGAIVHFERFSKGNQLNDLYQFTRKAMEKNHYDLDLLEQLLLSYDQVIPLTKEAYRYIYILFSYPEKFWKIANGYYNGNKAFLSPKYIEKLKTVICQEEEKGNMLTEYFAFHLQGDFI